MKVYYYIFSWLLTLLTGLLLGSVFMPGDISVVFAFNAVAAVLSAPFMLIFCIIMFRFLKKKPSSSALHARTFLLHLLGSFLTVLVMSLAMNEIMPIELNLIIMGYFVIDSIYFHMYIHARHTESEDQKFEENDILDSPLEN